MTFNKSMMALAITSLTFSAGHALAKVSAEEAAKLGNELTPVGAERAGNATGTIPEWTGGMTTPPAGYQAGGPRIDPFADEQPLFVIDASNYQQHADKLSEGQKMMFEKYGETFKMRVFKTHRTAAAPQWVYDNTIKNATTGMLTEDGNGTVQANGGFPFPIANNGLEAIWNHNLRWKGEGVYKEYMTAVTYEDGNRSYGGVNLWEKYPTHTKGVYDPDFNGNIMELLVSYTGPIRRKGEVIVVLDPVNQSETPRQAWQYIPGQRRVRRAPTIAFDTPNSGGNGQITYDDTFMFNGSPERYDWKLVGKKEMYVLYNSNGFLSKFVGKPDEALELLTPNHVDSSAERWELHRTWVVQATVKEGKRHAYGSRTYYLDEDTWTAVLADSFDGRGNLWRTNFTRMLNAYDVPITTLRATSTHDFQNNAYFMSELDTKPVRFYEGEASKYFTAGQIRKMSRR
ncbi:MAG: DUF1329 domain-containing protein [Motiliproteus sp.]